MRFFQNSRLFELSVFLLAIFFTIAAALFVSGIFASTFITALVFGALLVCYFLGTYILRYSVSPFYTVMMLVLMAFVGTMLEHHYFIIPPLILESRLGMAVYYLLLFFAVRFVVSLIRVQVLRVAGFVSYIIKVAAAVFVIYWASTLANSQFDANQILTGLAIILLLNGLLQILYVKHTPLLKVLSGPLIDRTFEVSKEAFKIGANDTDDLCLKSYYGVKPSHIKIILYQAPFVYIAQSNHLDGVTLLNFYPLDHQILENGDIITLGSAKLQFFY